MDMEKLKNGEIRNEIRKYLGFPKEPDKTSVTVSDEEINEFRSITIQIDRFLENVLDSDSPLNWFNVETMTEEKFIQLAAIFINRSKQSRNIYQQMKKIRSTTDYKALVYGDMNVTVSDNIYADYKYFLYHPEELDNSVYISPSDKYKCKIAKAYSSHIQNAIDFYKPGVFDWYNHLLLMIKYTDNYYFKETLPSIDSENDEFGLVNSLFIELYADLICDIVNNSLISWIYCNIRFTDSDAVDDRESPEEIFNAILHEVKNISTNVKSYVNRISSCSYNNYTINDYMMRFVNYMERKAIYKEMAETRGYLMKEIQENPDKFSFDTFYYKTRQKLRNASDNKQKYSKIFITEDERVTDFDGKIQSIKELLKIAESNSNLYYLYTVTYKLFFQEIYSIKTNSPVFHESANTIIKDFLAYGCDWKSDRKLQISGIEDASNVEIFNAKRHHRQRLRFLDAKFARAFLVSYYDPGVYKIYCEIIETVENTILMTYSAIDTFKIYYLLHFIVEEYIDFLLFKNKKTEMNRKIQELIHGTNN